MTRRLALVLVTALTCVNLNVHAQLCPDAEPVTQIGERFTTGLRFKSGGSERQKQIPHPDSRYMRVRIEVADPGNCDWLLTVRDHDFHVVQTFNADDFREAPNRWTNRVNFKKREGSNSLQFSKVIFTLEGCKGGSLPEIKFPEYIAMPETVKSPYYSLQVEGHPTYQSLYGLDFDNASTHKPLGDYVGFVMSSWGRQTWTCSGVFLKENLFLTNWHCGGPGVFKQDGQIVKFPDAGNWKNEIVKDTIIDVSFDDDGLSQEYIGNRLLAMDRDLDFALLEVLPVDSRRRMRPLTINVTPLTAGTTTLKIVHHPSAKQKMITLAGCRVEGADFPGWISGTNGIDFTHKCDTERGSSGGPIFNSNNELVGLHHRGFDVNPQTCHRVGPPLNKAVKIKKIIEYLQACNPDIASQLSLTGTAGTVGVCPNNP